MPRCALVAQALPILACAHLPNAQCLNSPVLQSEVRATNQTPERTRSSREIFFECEERDINHTGAHATATPRAQPLHAEGPPTGAPSRSQVLAMTSSQPAAPVCAVSPQSLHY
jgi:hypothetical protein